MKELLSRLTQSKENLFLLICTIIGGVLFFFLYPKISPTSKLNLEINRSEAQDIARDYLDALGYNIRDFDQNVFLRANLFPRSPV